MSIMNIGIGNTFVILETDINLAGSSIEDVYEAINGFLVDKTHELVILPNQWLTGSQYITGRVFDKNEAAMVKLVAPCVQFFYPFNNDTQLQD